MKRLFYLLFGLVLLPALLYAQGSLSLKDINDNLTNNYYTKTVSDGKYATTVDVALKADKTYVDGTDENIINTLLPAKADQSDMDSAEAAINALNIDNDSQDITIESNRIGISSLEVGLQTHQNMPADAHPASAITYTDTSSIGATELQAALDTVAVWLNSVDLRLESLETNIISLIQPAIDIITANLDTHETAITALITNDQTQEVRLVRATAAYENRYKKMILQYGYPIAINDLWDVNKASAIYAMYDIVVFGDLYEKETHEAHIDTVNIISKVKILKTDIEIFGYIPIGGGLGANLDTAEIQLRIDEWLATGATGIFLDEFGYDYLVTRERQNMAVDYAHSKGMNVIANSWNIDWVFNNDDGYIEWEEFYGNPNLVAPSINSNDYYLFENLFYYYEGGQKVSDQWRIYEVYRYYYDSATSTWGKNYYDQFGTKTLGLDGIQSTNANKDLYFINAYVGGRIINLDGYGASIELWGSSSTAYNHYNPSFFNNEASMFHRDKIQPTVSDYSGATYAQYDTKINGVTAKLIWKPGATASNPTLGTHKVQINGVDRTKTYVSSSATNTNTASTLVARDASGNFSAGTITAALTGNASTATQLATPRTIAGTSFDGTANINISHTGLTDKGTLTHTQVETELARLETDKADTSSVTAVSDALAAHTGEVSGAHQGSAIAVDSSGFTGNLKLADDTVQKALATLDALSGLPATNAITKIYGDADVDGSGTGAVWLVGTNGVTIDRRVGNTFEVNIDSATKFNDYYTAAQTNATIEAAIAAIPTPSVNQTVTVTAGEALTAGQVVSLINESGTIKAYNNPITVSTSPNGAESVFNAAETTYCSAVALDSTRFVVSYIKADNIQYSIVGTVSGSTISWGAEQSGYGGTNGSYVSVVKLRTNAFVVFRTNSGATGANNVIATYHTVSGSTISIPSSTTNILTNSGTYVSASQLDTDKVILCFRDSVTTTGKAIIVTYSGDALSKGAEVEFNAAATAYISVSALSSTSAIVAYQDGGNSNYGTAQVLSISGTTITPGTEYVFKSATTQWVTCAAGSSTTAVIVYRNSSDTYLSAVFATISGTAISYGTELVTSMAGINYPSIAMISSTKFLVGCDTYVNPTHTGKSVILNTSGTSITADTAYTTNAAGTYYNAVCYLGSQKSVMTYQDDGNSTYGTAVVNQWGTSNYASISGISQGAYSSGSDAVVLISGTNSNQSGLITGSPYFLQSDFTIGTTPISLAKYYNSSTATGEIKVGTAKSATEIILGIDYK